MTPITERRRLLFQLAEHLMFDYVDGRITSGKFARKLYNAMLDECKDITHALATAEDERAKQGERGAADRARVLGLAVAEMEGLRVAKDVGV